MDAKSLMMTTPFHGIISWISPSKGSILFSRMKTLSVRLNPTLAYKIILADPSFKIISSNPTTVPISGILLILQSVLKNSAVEGQRNPKVRKTSESYFRVKLEKREF